MINYAWTPKERTWDDPRSARERLVRAATGSAMHAMTNVLVGDLVTVLGLATHTREHGVVIAGEAKA